MKANLRKTMINMVSEACEELPGANELVNGSRTRAATALKGLLIAAIQRVCQNNPGSTHPIDLARKTIFHDRFRTAFAQLPEIFTPDQVYPPNMRFLAGLPVSFDTEVQVCRWGAFKLSYAEDLLSTPKDTVPCGQRVSDILDLFRKEMAAQIPTADTSLIRSEIDANGKYFIVYPGFNEVCLPEDIKVDINSRFCAHDKIDTRFNNTVWHQISTQVRRADYAANLPAHACDVELKIKAALERIAPELPLEYQGIQVFDNGEFLAETVIYEGLTFDFETGEVRTKLSNDVERYIKYSLPSIVRAQRLLHERMPSGYLSNVLVEAPLVRHMMEQFGGYWVAEAYAITGSPSGKKYKRSNWSARVSQGILRGSFKLSSEVHWRNGELHVETTIPDTAVGGLQGKLLSDIVEHPYFGLETHIVSARKKTLFRKNADGPYEPYSVLILRTNTPELRLQDFGAALAKAA